LFERLGLLETRLLRQFNALDALVGQLTNVSNFLTQQLANLPSVSFNK
jgi:flagellar hook-associated protein 2